MTMRPVNSYANPELTGFHMPPGTPRAGPAYWVFRTIFRLLIPMLWQTRVFNRHREPTSGGVLYLCNHQGFLDPVMMAFALRRPMNFMARDTLFPVPVLGWFIRAVNSFPIRRGKADTGALKEAMRRVKAGHQVVLFPEGTRTHDGRIGPFLPGAAFLAQRANAVTIPVVIDGAFEFWPRTRKCFSPGGNLILEYGRPYSTEEARSMKPQEFVDHLRGEMIEMQTDIRRRLGRPALKYDKDEQG